MSTNAPPKAVLDTNILCRFLLTPRGFSAKLYRALETNRCRLVTSETILAEVLDVLHRPRVLKYRHLSESEIDALLDAFRHMAIVVPGHYEVFVVPTDPKDNPIVACALEADADYIVTDDRRDLLPLKHYRRIQIVSAPDFLRLF